MRQLAILSSAGYLVLAGFVALLSVSEQDSNALATTAIVGIPLVAAGFYLRAAVLRSRWPLLLPAWVAMLAGSVVLISFSFIVWPLVLLALPYTVTAHRKPGLA